MKRVVIVEDDCYMREELEYTFLREEYQVFSITSFQNTTQDVLHYSPDLVVLDINLPGATGFEICRSIKEQMNIPVLILTSRDQMKDELHALDLGADEYLVKPCHKERIIARASNLLKRFEGRKHMLDGNGFLLDSQTYTLYCQDKSVLLPENQGKILELLLLHIGEVVEKAAFFHALWGTTEYIDENALQVNMTRLKKTLKGFSLEHRIVTERGKGYRFLKELDG